MSKSGFVAAGRIGIVLPALALLFVFAGCGPRETLNAEALASGPGFEHDRRLQAETDALLKLFDNMKPVRVYLSDEAVLGAGTNTEKGSAYTHCYRQNIPVIYLKKVFYQKANRKQLVNALKHELTHAFLCRRSEMSAGHGESFQKKFKAVGGFGN